MLFTYWNNPKLDLPPSAVIWQERFPHFSVFGDKDVLPLLESDQLRELYVRISLPACKSDIARLLLLRKHGGLYLDAHAAPVDGDQLAETLGLLSSYELLLFSKTWQAKTATDSHLMNTVIAARRNAPTLTHLIITALANLVRQQKLEQEKGYVPYHLFSLTGTKVIMDCFFKRTNNVLELSPEFADRVYSYKMTSPSSPGFKLYQFYNYRKPGDHWSERQKSERLFLIDEQKIPKQASCILGDDNTSDDAAILAPESQ
jgi:hypothetical protein